MYFVTRYSDMISMRVIDVKIVSIPTSDQTVERRAQNSEVVGSIHALSSMYFFDFDSLVSQLIFLCFGRVCIINTISI